MSASSKKKLRKEQAAEALTEKQLREQKEAKKLKIYTISFIAVIALVVCIAVGVVCGQMYARSGIIERNSDAVKIGNHTLSAAQLNFYYIDSFNQKYNGWYNSFTTYTASALQTLYGLDLSKPLNTQPYMSDKDKTWADYFADLAVSDAKNTYALYDLAVSEGKTLSDEEKKAIDTTISNVQTSAKKGGYGSLSSYLKAIYGNGATEKSFREYLEVTTLAQSFYSAHYDGLTYTDEQIETYNKDHYIDFSSFTFASYYLPVSDFLTGGTKDEDGKMTYSDEENQAAAKTAETAVEELKKQEINSKESLDKAIAALIAYKSEEKKPTSTLEENKLYTGLNANQSVLDWLAEDGRKAGDFAVIPSTSTTKDDDGKETTKTNGYYLVCLIKRADNEEKLVNIRHILSKFEGGTKDENGKTVYSDAEKKAAKDQIDKVLQEWKNGDATEDSFSALVKDNTDDPGSKENGGLYEKVYPGMMVTAFNDWCFAEGRKVGDCEIVETELGYHLIYFSAFGDQTYRQTLVEATMRSEDQKKWAEEIYKAMEVTTIDTTHLDMDRIFASSY